MRNLFIALLALAPWLGAAQLGVTQGVVIAHTEVFGDSTIDPSTTAVTSHLQMPEGIDSIHGEVVVSMVALASDNKDRDEHMHEAMESAAFPHAVYTIESVAAKGEGYALTGTLQLHGVSKPLAVEAQIADANTTLNMKGNASFLMSEFGIKPPTLLFLTVRDQVDITFDVTFAKE